MQHFAGALGKDGPSDPAMPELSHRAYAIIFHSRSWNSTPVLLHLADATEAVVSDLDILLTQPGRHEKPSRAGYSDGGMRSWTWYHPKQPAAPCPNVVQLFCMWRLSSAELSAGVTCPVACAGRRGT